MRLVCQSALGSNVTQSSVRGEHESLRPLDTSPDDICVRRIADAVSECDIEVINAEAGNGREVLVFYGCTQIRFDMRQHSSDLPRCETSPSIFLSGLR